MRRVAILTILLLAVAAPAAADTEPSRLLVTAASDRCAGGLPVVDYTVTNVLPTAVSAQIWWVADASVYGVVGREDLGPKPDSATGSFTLPYDFYATVTVYATAAWPDGQVITNASWAIPVADCTASAPPPTTVAESTTTVPTTTTIDDGGGSGNGNGYGYGHATTTTGAG
jgi:hypothetical protein